MSSVPHDPVERQLRAGLRYGWSALLLFALGGLTLEFLHLIKWPLYLDQHLRRELWVLAHAHGALLALLDLIWVALLPRLPQAAGAGGALRWGAALVPAGFFLGGIGNTETDPSLLILATPVGAALVLWALAVTARTAWRAPSPATATTASPPSTTATGRRRR